MQIISQKWIDKAVKSLKETNCLNNVQMDHRYDRTDEKIS